MVNEQEENFKIQDLERKIFTPARNRVMCEAFLKEAQRDPAGKIGKSIVFAVNQTHATNLTKIFNEIQPNIAVTITSRDQGSLVDREGVSRRQARRADRGVRGHAFHRLQLPRPAQHRPHAARFSRRPNTSRSRDAARGGTHSRSAHTEYEKKNFFLLDFCAVAEYFEEKYDYSVPLAVPREKKGRGAQAASARRWEPGPAKVRMGHLRRGRSRRAKSRLGRARTRSSAERSSKSGRMAKRST